MHWLPMMMLLAFLTGCQSNLIDNPSFDRWCGDKLCDWSVDEGQIQRVGSWHQDDYAVSFVLKGTRISQVTPRATDERCIHFETIADVDALANLRLLVDFGDDGHVDVDMPVPEAHWQKTSVVFSAPAAYDKVRYAFEKREEGRAVLAQLWAVGCSEAAATQQQQQ